MKAAIAVLSLAAASSMFAGDPAMTQKERDQVIQLLKDSREEFLKAVTDLTDEQWKWKPAPERFEAGTPNISGAIGLGKAVDFLSGLDRDAAHAHESALLHHATAVLSKIPGLRIIGTAADKASLVSFAVAGVHPHDLGTILDEDGIAVRTGHHCAMPVMDFFKLPATARASFAFYNRFDEIDRLGAGIERARKLFV